MQLQIGVKVIIKNKHGAYLFVQRTKLLQNEKEISWDIPGGRIESSERLREALEREVLEEIGVKLSGDLELLNAQDIFVDTKGLHVVRLTYLTSQDIDTIQLSDEHDSHKWMTIDEVMKLNVDPYLKETLLPIG